MFTTIHTTLKSTTTLLIVTLFLLGNYAYSQWNPAPTGPPGSNVAAPINTSSQLQYKAGTLDANAYKVTSGAPTVYYDDTNNRSFWTHANSDRFYVLGDRNDNGSWDGPHPLELYLGGSGGEDFAQFANQVRAPLVRAGSVSTGSVCHSSGANCVTPAQLYSLVHTAPPPASTCTIDSYSPSCSSGCAPGYIGVGSKLCDTSSNNSINDAVTHCIRTVCS